MPRAKKKKDTLWFQGVSFCAAASIATRKGIREAKLSEVLKFHSAKCAKAQFEHQINYPCSHKDGDTSPK